jgi:inorganic phosphate transporter, PiT family
MFWFAFLFVATVFLAYANGANDNFKGVATLWGSQTTNYKAAIAWATGTTFLGSVCSLILAEKLLKAFSGKGLVPDAIAQAMDFHLAVALAAGGTVILATVFGFPISTTHGLVGSMVGAGLVAIGLQVNFAALGQNFLLPLLLSPVVAITIGMLTYGGFQYLRVALGIQKEWCIRVGNTQKLVPISQPTLISPSAGWAIIPQTMPSTFMSDVAIDKVETRTQRYQGRVFGIKSQALVDTLHYISAGVVSFARGLNDTPKIVALLLIGQSISAQGGMLSIALGMAVGGLLNAQKVAETMSKKITALNPGQGFSANLATGTLVIAASYLGWPVSTTHVSVSAIFGTGILSKTAQGKVFMNILLSWVLTLPLAALLGSCFYALLSSWM